MKFFAPDPRNVALRAWFFALSCALLFAACATGPGMAQQNAQVRELARAYGQSLERDMRLGPLWEKMPTAANEATPDMLARTDYAGPRDKALLRDLSQRALAYRQSLAALLRGNGVDARLIELWEQGADAGDALRAQLHNGAIPWGVYNTRMRDIHTTQRMALAEAQEAIDARDAAQLQRAQRSTQEAYLAALAMPAAAQASPARSVRNCETIGRALYCE
jgi:hypothetical protein